MPTPTNLPASFVSGDILTAANMNLLRGGFRVLQVVQGTIGTSVSNSTTTAAATLLTATITPSSTSSKVLVLVSQNGCSKSAGNTENAIHLQLFRDATGINLFAVAAGYTGTALLTVMPTLSTVFLDSPNSVAALIYSTKFKNNFAASSVSVQINAEVSTITLLEISA